ncbi:hypothetical protein KIN20_014102 [Parelaphostrongylus tenuis]|uniref:Uncharacterized protein n=1 Tax=Parelaphostrongylus tenuis TaxID=148309 RepID=A0AAD5QP66_PARTN|nr:hypothetical protein KIN20_014102 [Parelaphostrongylus tenuis]
MLTKSSLHSIFTLLYTIVSADHYGSGLMDEVRKIIANKPNYNRNEYPNQELERHRKRTIFTVSQVNILPNLHCLTLDCSLPDIFIISCLYLACKKKPSISMLVSPSISFSAKSFQMLLIRINQLSLIGESFSKLLEFGLVLWLNSMWIVKLCITLFRRLT